MCMCRKCKLNGLRDSGVYVHVCLGIENEGEMGFVH